MLRSLVVWIPDWPVVAGEREGRIEAGEPVAVIDKNTVVACSATARAEGVRRGQRRRDAQARSSRLRILPADPVRDQRVFAPVVASIEERIPHVQILRPGLCALRARGPARFYGGEEAAAAVLRETLAGQGLPEVRVGIADGPFTAEQAARATTPARPILIVPPGTGPEFLAPLPVTVLDEPSLAHLLARLGVRTLGGFAELAEDRVRERLGEHGVRLRSLAAGRDPSGVEARVPPPELDRETWFDPPVELAEQIAFGMRIAADEFIAGLDVERLVCTELRVELETERGERSERVWLHPGTFDAAAIVDRVRWQLAEADVLSSGVTRVRISPEAVDAASAHTPSLFGGGGEEKVHHALSRVQAILGHRAVLTPLIAGGRWLDERQVLVPWGDRAAVPRDPAQPWPGSLPPPLPSTVFPLPRRVMVTGAGEATVQVDDRGQLVGAPETLGVDGESRAIVSWAGPWPVLEREWDDARRRLAHRFQVVDDEQRAWLLVCEGGEWRAEARYD
ncbi:DNA polymerase Y family protein [Microbacterium sp. SORGH_AS_0888]|uniref:DNA polymerase Y family protein n=1 Tax=Microbacterium sp. SORGH_AS_0888 TaxID=3041791 RepID=UPI00277E4F8E|nr:DNA polymerase Y family protein [Microbacterium sp. SORGH_AS_0888]MDQ1131110.1 protein ImuB [Microbacterium sp. SORGH_AS_0888]